jgi:hypothetical protein
VKAAERLGGLNRIPRAPLRYHSRLQAYFEPLDFTTIIYPSFLLAPSVDFQAGGTLQSKFKIRQRT